MQYSVGVEYAFHTLFYMIDIEGGKTVSIKELSALHNVSETYLSKMFTKLKKAGIVRSVPGAKGGYELALSPEDVSFWDIVEAVEGSSNIFTCCEIRKNNILNDGSESYHAPCVIKTVMNDAEEEMRNYLRKKSLLWLYEEANKTFSAEKLENISNWKHCNTKN